MHLTQRHNVIAFHYTILKYPNVLPLLFLYVRTIKVWAYNYVQVYPILLLPHLQLKQIANNLQKAHITTKEKPMQRCLTNSW